MLVKCVPTKSLYIVTCTVDSLYTDNTLLERARVDKRVFWPQYFRNIEYVCLIGFIHVLT